MSKKELEIIIAEDNAGHAGLIKMNLLEAGIKNKITHFKNGEETLNFLKKTGEGPHRKSQTAYLLLLDIRMPKVDGIEVLREIKNDETLKKMPVIMLTTTDDPKEIEKCHAMGCNSYITKPVDFEKMIEIAKKLSKNIIHVRIDLYYINERIYFGEYTFHNNGGIVRFSPPEWNKIIGDMIKSFFFFINDKH